MQILGTNFQLPPTPPPTGKTTPPNPSVRVLFGASPAVRVDVVTDGMLHVLTPIGDAGVCTVTIQNIDQNGNVVSGEQVVVPNAYTYTMPALATPTTIAESLLAFVIRSLLRELKRQVLPNVVMTTNVDYDDSTSDAANIAALATVPGIVLTKPVLRENRLYSSNQPRQTDGAFTSLVQQRPGYTVDVVFTIIGVDDKTERLLNLMQEVTNFFHQNIVLTVRNPSDQTQSTDYDMHIESPPAVVSGANSSNLGAFSGTFAVLGVTLDDDDMATGALYELIDVFPMGSVDPTPNAIILTGTPGTTPVAPIAPNPPAEVGKRFSIEQFLAQDDEE